MINRYWATIAWDGAIDDNGEFIADSEGEFVFSRERLNYLVEGIGDYISKWSGRNAYLESASKETESTNPHFKKYTDLTDLIKQELQTIKNKENT